MLTFDLGFLEAVFYSMEIAGGQPVDEVDVGLVHLPQELSGMG